MIQFSADTISAQDDKAFLARLDAQEAEVLRNHDETIKKVI